MSRLLFATVLFLFTTNLFAQFDFNARCKEAYAAVSNLELERAKQLLALEHKENPGNLIPLFIENYMDFLRITIGEQEQDFKQLKSNKNIRIKALEEGPDSSPFYLYCQAGINLQWALARSKFNDYTRAVFEARKAYFMLQKNRELFPDFTPNLIGLGLLHSLIGTVPDEYQWIANIFGFQGSVDRGMDELRQAYRELPYGEYGHFQQECLFFITFLSMNFQTGVELESSYLGALEGYAEESIILRYAYGRYLMKSGSNDLAVEVFLNRRQVKGQYPFFYLDYLLGKAKLNRLDPDADRAFYSYVTNHKGENYIKASYQKLAWHSLVEGNEMGYFQKMDKVRRYGDVSVDEDKQAMMEAEGGMPPNVALLKGRLLFDGGYYTEAENMLMGPNVLLATKRDSVEYNYRLGRVSHSSGKLERAKMYYQRCIDQGSDLTYYFAANAALQTGLIYEDQGDYPKAMEYYRLCLSLDFDEYRTSILQKAKAGTNRVKRSTNDRQED